MSQNVVLPLAQRLPWYEFTMTLSGTRYLVEVQYNLRMDRWFLTLSDAQGQRLLSGIPILINRDLTAQYPTVDLPQGALFAVDQTGLSTQPGLKAFLTSHVLVYAT